MTRDRWFQLSIEATAIVLSVLLALAVNQWWQARSDRALVERVLDTIASEIAENRPRVSRALAYHDSLIAEIRERRFTGHVLSLPYPGASADGHNFEAMDRLVREALSGLGAPPWLEVAVAGGPDGRPLLSFRESDLSGRIEIIEDSLRVHLPRGIELRAAFLRNSAWTVALATRATVHMPFDVVAAVSDLHELQRSYAERKGTVLDMLYAGSFRMPALEDLRNLERDLLERYDHADGLLRRP